MSQPMDQCVIRCLNANYRKHLVKLILRSLDSNKPLPKVSLLTDLNMLESVWNEVSQTTILSRKLKFQRKVKELHSMMKTIHSKI